MRQFILIASLVGLVMYAGFVGQHGTAPSAAAAATNGPLGALQRSFLATGGTLQKVQMTGWVQVASPDVLPGVTKALGWTDGTHDPEEVREAKLHKRDGHQFLSVRWVLTAGAVSSWQGKYARIDKALESSGKSASITVQLEGTTAEVQPLSAATRAMNAVLASGRQPWSDAHAASIAGRTAQLPDGPFGVNVQVAVRRESAAKVSRVWVAWPALQQEY